MISSRYLLPGRLQTTLPVLGSPDMQLLAVGMAGGKRTLLRAFSRVALRKAKTLCFLLIVFTCSCFVIYKSTMLRQRRLRSSQYLIYTETCQIPLLDPFDSIIMKHIHENKSKPCPVVSYLTYQDNHVLRLNRSMIKRMHIYCRAYPITRNNINDESIEYKKETIEFQDDVLIRDEFIKVICFDRNNNPIYTNFHAFIQQQKIVPTKKVRNKRLDWLRTIYKTRTIKSSETRIPVKKKPLNILMIGVDSISRLNSIRQMPLTRTFLLERGAVEMAGYNKVADNTLVNMVPILAGKYLNELPWNEGLRHLPFDKYELVWKIFKKHGFVTMFAEDVTKLATFNYLKAGFREQPTDHYYRPLALAMEAEEHFWSASHSCIQKRMETEMVLQYTYDFTHVYKDNTPYFGLSFLTHATHDDINGAGLIDETYMKFFEKLFQQELLNNTILFFFSDHGTRFGSYRKTYNAKLEDRLPLMLIIPPPWLKSRYPQKWNNLNINSRRLTTPFDIYETLIGILDLDKSSFELEQTEVEPISRKRINLFSVVPGDRTCDEASIVSHWCTCHATRQLSTEDDLVVSIAMYIVTFINKKMGRQKELCARLRLSKILNAGIFISGDQVLDFRSGGRNVDYDKAVLQTYADYQLTIVTVPGLGQFEASVRYHLKDKSFQSVGDIVRINAYGHESDCITISHLKRFCYCPQNTDI